MQDVVLIVRSFFRVGARGAFLSSLCLCRVHARVLYAYKAASMHTRRSSEASSHADSVRLLNLDFRIRADTR